MTSKVVRRRWLPAAAPASLFVVAALSLGCASYRGSATAIQPSTVPSDGDWLLVRHFPLVLQERSNDCGAAALSAVMQFWGKPATPDAIEAALGRTGSRLQAGDMETYARQQGLSSFVFFGTMKDVVHELERGRPVIVGLGKQYESDKALSHYEVIVGYEPKQKKVLLLDPGRGWQIDGVQGFAREWAMSKAVTVVAFLPAREAHERHQSDVSAR